MILALSAAGSAQADPVAVHDAATRLFPDMPEVVETAAPDRCGLDQTVSAPMVHCTSDNTILVRPGALSAPDAGYRMAHVLGHAIQVRHGIADIALREIRRRRDEEAALRGLVTRQVECLAGVLFAEAGLPATDLATLYAEEPHTGSHWGRDPLRRGPQVSIGLAPRAEWFSRGQAEGEVAACAVGEIPVAPLIDALR
ncbi:hypothetical protein ATO11_02900 [Pseudaestuariivita atlantica]|uniref:Uncharacterized protein n=1 Tax=Pseudaestuariivita atlantica TaxID=1317121 RepID=A0A0L1JUX9_9RHOB|nr:hypothetical protein ATO11_02900 [Pseudaestuariivita atlantica]